MSKPAPQDGWKHKGGGSGPTPAAASRRSWQQGGTAPPKPTKPRSRVWPLLFAGGFAAALIALLVVVILWYGRGKTPAFVFVAPYSQKSLAAPDNAVGRKTADALADWSRTEVKDRDAWENALTPTGGGLVLYFAAPAGADASGPFLWLPPVKPDAGLGEADKLPVATILKKLEGVRGPKLLVFDVTPAVANPAQSGTYQDFARGLKEMSAAIETDSRLCVMCSVNDDQRAWADERHGGTVFGYYFAHGVRGAGHNPSNEITGRTLFQYLSKEVNTWAVKYRDAGQTPMLLPEKGGEERAEKITLGITPPPPGYQPAELKPAAVNWDDLKAEWDATAELEKKAPETTDPEGWRRHLDWRGRWEQAVRTGGRSDIIRTAAGDARRQVEARAPGEYPLVSLAVPTAGSSRDKWATAQLAFDDVVRATDKPDVWKKADEVLRDKVYTGGTDRPVETHLLRMLQQHLGTPRPDPALLKAALKLREEAEQAAWGGTSARRHPEQAFRWSRHLVERTDTQRQQGEDLLFQITPDAWAAAKERLDACRPRYAEATRRANVVSAAVDLRDRLFARLPYYARWVADGERSLVKSRQENPAVIDDLTARVETAARKANDLHAGLSDAPANEGAATEAVRKLERDTNEAKKAFEEVERAFGGEVDSLLVAQAQPSTWHALDAAAGVPFLPAEKRFELFRKLTQVTDELFAKAADPKDTERKAADARPAALRHLRMTGTVLGIPPPAEGAPHAEFRKASDDLGKRLRDCQKLARERYEAAVAVPQLTAAEQGESPGSATDRRLAEKALADAAREARLADPVAPATLDPDVVAADRGYRRHRFALRQAERATRDGWAEVGTPDPNTASWYCRKAADALVKNAKAAVKVLNPNATNEQEKVLFAACTAVEGLRPTVLTPKPPESQLVVKDYPNWKFEFPLAASGEVTGFPVYWLDLPPRYQSANPGRGVRKAARGLAAGTVPPNIDEPPFDMPKGNSSGAKEDLVTQVLYRGHVARETTALVYAGEPTLEIVYTKPPRPAVALIADPAAVSGAVLFLIDRSASMRWKSQKEGGGELNETKTKKAMAGLQTVIDAMPRGTSVAVGGFHDSNGPQTNLAVKPTKLDGAERGWEQLKMNDRLDDVGAVKNAETPIALSIQKVLDPVTGRDFWPEGFTGARTLVVLTDGDDNISEKPGQIIQKALVKADGDVKLHMVFFDMTDADETNAKKQFEFLAKQDTFADSGKLPASLHAGAKTGKDFAKALDGAFRPRLRYDSTSASTPERDVLTAKLLGANAADPSPELLGSEYKWKCGEKEGTLRVAPGDRVLVQAGMRGGRFDVFIPPAAYNLAADPKWQGRVPFHKAGDPDDSGAKVYLTVPGVQRPEGPTSKHLKLTATLERDAGGKELRLNRPRFPWFDATGTGDQPRVRVESRWGLTAPAWDVTLYDVEQNKKPVFQTKGVAGHWIDDEVLKAVKPARRFNRNLAAMSERVAAADGIAAWVQTSGDKKYLVVDLKLDQPGELVYLWAKDWTAARPNDPRPNEHHRYYAPQARYTVEYGPLTDDQLKQEVAFDVYPVKDLRARAAALKRAVKWEAGPDDKFTPVEPTGLSLMEPKKAK